MKREDYTFEDLVSRGMQLRERADDLSWELGDLAILATEKFGREGFNEFAKTIDIKITTLRRYRDVAKSYPKKKIRKEFAALSWSHFRQVAAKDDRILLLTRACDESWSCEKLMQMTQSDKSKIIDDGKIVPPRPEQLFDKNCRRWYVLDKKLMCPNKGKCPARKTATRVAPFDSKLK